METIHHISIASLEYILSLKKVGHKLSQVAQAQKLETSLTKAEWHQIIVQITQARLKVKGLSNFMQAWAS